MPFVFQVLAFVFEFPLQKFHGMFRVHAEDFGNAEELRVFVDDDAGAWGKRFFAVRKGVEGVHGNLRIGPWLQVDEDFDTFTRVVVHVLNLDFALVVCLYDAVDKACGRRAVRDFPDGERLVVDLFDFCADADLAAAHAVVVVAHVDDAAGKEVRVKRELLPFEDSDACFAKFAEVVGENARGKAHGDAVDTLCQEQREFDREGDRFFATAIVAWNPFCSFRVKDDIYSERGEATFDVTRGGSVVAREGVTPVTLGIYK